MMSTPLFQTIATDVAQVVLMDGNLTQLNHLFELAQAFDANMKLNFMAATVPNIICIGGALFFGWGLMTTVLVSQISTPIAIYNALRPLLNGVNHP
jgi:cation transport ATPase